MTRIDQGAPPLVGQGSTSLPHPSNAAIELYRERVPVLHRLLEEQREALVPEDGHVATSALKGVDLASKAHELVEVGGWHLVEGAAVPLLLGGGAVLGAVTALAKLGGANLEAERGRRLNDAYDAFASGAAAALDPRGAAPPEDPTRRDAYERGFDWVARQAPKTQEELRHNLVLIHHGARDPAWNDRDLHGVRSDATLARLADDYEAATYKSALLALAGPAHWVPCP